MARRYQTQEATVARALKGETKSNRYLQQTQRIEQTGVAGIVAPVKKQLQTELLKGFAAVHLEETEVRRRETRKK
jgi:hypothetical protein